MGELFDLNLFEAMSLLTKIYGQVQLLLIDSDFM